MRVVTAKQMAEIDKLTIDGGFPAIELMENAGGEVVSELFELYPDLNQTEPIAICCGKGNNGGDGLVVARLLYVLGFTVTVFLPFGKDDFSEDAGANFTRLPEGVTVVLGNDDPAMDWYEIAVGSQLCIDAILGTGIKLPLRDTMAEICEAFNHLEVDVVSIDIPSGVDGNNGKVDPVAVRADVTITIGLPKLGLLTGSGRHYAGHIEVVDIGFDDSLTEHKPGQLEYLDELDYADMLPIRYKQNHKYDCGSLLIIAGSNQYTGAAMLTTGAALRSGAGMITAAVPGSCTKPVLIHNPEAVVSALAETDAGTIAAIDSVTLQSLLEKKNALAIGPGMGNDKETASFICDFLTKLDLPMVIDADALNAFATCGVEPEFVSENVVLTPHMGELSRLSGIDINELTADKISELAKKWKVTLVAKGAPTIIGHPDGTVTINPTGDDSLAHCGTGDVLTGLVGGLLAQGCSSRNAALLGCYIHGLAGELVNEEISCRSITATQVMDCFGFVFKDLEA
ncbi:NAD(P)H-hydrate dehydratase [bacterium]|nr:NAD(P)H-hydrate dehydratase [bacterium]